MKQIHYTQQGFINPEAVLREMMNKLLQTDETRELEPQIGHLLLGQSNFNTNHQQR